MTCVEKLRQDHPEMNEFEIGYLVGQNCPNEHGYPEPHDCDFDCKNCWDREIPEPSNFADSVAQAGKIVREAVKNIQRIAEEAKEMAVEVEPVILDSGDRTEFESGAVRDMREGKGRCDLVPLEVAARVFCDPVLNPRDYDINLTDIRKFQETGSTNYLYYVLRRFSKEYGGYETMLLEVAKHYEEGAKKYGPDNWQKGMPVWCYIDSAVRHYLKWRRGDKDEPHNNAFCWNLMCCIWEVDYREKEE